MYLSAEKTALANRAVVETFENTCIAWQAIPHWDTGDPGQTRVPADLVDDAVPPSVTPLVPVSEPFDVTLAMAVSADVDSLINRVTSKTVLLAKKVDDAVIAALHAASKTKSGYDESALQAILDALIGGRAEVEKAGYLAPACLMTDTTGIQKLNQLSSGYPIMQPVLDAANVNSLHRVDTVGAAVGGKDARAILLGRRRRIPHGGGAEASPGEEPVDIAVSVPPGLECVGENGDNKIAMSVRISYALRVKDNRSLIGFIAV